MYPIFEPWTSDSFQHHWWRCWLHPFLCSAVSLFSAMVFPPVSVILGLNLSYGGVRCYVSAGDGFCNPALFRGKHLSSSIDIELDSHGCF